MPYLIDSDWLIDHLNDVPEANQLIASLVADRVFVSIISYMETYQGTLRADSPLSATVKLDALIEDTAPLPVSVEVAQRCARLREALRGARRRVDSRAFDLIIAATALEYDLTLVTRNVGDYADVPGIRLYETSQA